MGNFIETLFIVISLIFLVVILADFDSNVDATSSPTTFDDGNKKK